MNSSCGSQLFMVIIGSQSGSSLLPCSTAPASLQTEAAPSPEHIFCLDKRNVFRILLTLPASVRIKGRRGGGGNVWTCFHWWKVRLWNMGGAGGVWAPGCTTCSGASVPHTGEMSNLPFLFTWNVIIFHQMQFSTILSWLSVNHRPQSNSVMFPFSPASGFKTNSKIPLRLLWTANLSIPCSLDWQVFRFQHKIPLKKQFKVFFRVPRS